MSHVTGPAFQTTQSSALVTAVHLSPLNPIPHGIDPAFNPLNLVLLVVHFSPLNPVSFVIGLAFQYTLYCVTGD